MSKFVNSRKVYSFRQYEKLDSDNYVTYDIAWPVEVIECYANKVSEVALDALEEAVLELLNIKEMSVKRIVELLDISDDVINKIIHNLSVKRTPLYDETNKCVTDAGKDYIEKKDSDEFLEEKVFGNMFVSRIDGEVLPFFREGKLPWSREFEDILYLSYDAEEPSTLKGDRTSLVDRVNRSFHRYGRITKSSKEHAYEYKDKKNIEFIEEELRDQRFNEEETLADREQDINLKKARIKLLDTKPREIYIRCRLCVSKASPEKYIIESPFEENVTSWYSDCFHRMISNNEAIYVNDDDESGLEYFCEGITKKFYVEFPELQSKNFEQYIKIQFPKMLSCSISKICMDKYLEVFNYKVLCDEGKVKRHTIVVEIAKALELILNNYIARTNKESIVDKYKKGVQTAQEIEDLFDTFFTEQDWDSIGKKECSGKLKEKGNLDYNGRLSKKQTIMNHFIAKKNGFSVVEKYYFLVVEANYNSDSKFRRLLMEQGIEIIQYLDFINYWRNKIGGHVDGVKPMQITNEEYSMLNDYFVKATRLLLDYID